MKLNDNQKSVTIIIVTFKSDHIIEKCLDNIDKKFQILLIENSNNEKLTERLKLKYENLSTINIGYDSGFGYALNRGLENVKSDYIISINPDSFPEKDCFDKLISTANKNKDAVMVTPVTYLKNNTEQFTAFGFFKKKKPKKNEYNIMEVDWVNGNVFLLKKNVIEEIGAFDENFFLEYDERDFQRRIFLNKKKILIDFNAKSQHLEGKSADAKYSFQMKCEASWHHAWSRYYYYKKHFGFFYSLMLNIPFAIKNLLKFFIFFVLRDEKKTQIYKLYFLGSINSFLNRKSHYRAEIE